MTYTAWEIIIFLILAFLLGAFLVWLWMRNRDGEGDAQTIASLRADLEACKASKSGKEDKAAQRPKVKEAEPKVAAVATPAAKPAKKEAFTTDAPKPEAFSGAALAAAQANPDDLKKIWGVGPVMEGVLNDHGCYTFAQVASLSDRDVEWVAANINTFPDRITRDRWVSQAKKLAAEK